MDENLKTILNYISIRKQTFGEVLDKHQKNSNGQSSNDPVIHHIYGGFTELARLEAKIKSLPEPKPEKYKSDKAKYSEPTVPESENDVGVVASILIKQCKADSETKKNLSSRRNHFLRYLIRCVGNLDDVNQVAQDNLLSAFENCFSERFNNL